MKMYKICIKEPINLVVYATIFVPNTTEKKAEELATSLKDLIEQAFGYEDLYWTIQKMKGDT